MSRLISGTLMECFRHYADTFLPRKGSHNAAKAKGPMAAFIGVSTSTVTTWTSSNRLMPLGGPLNGLMFFMDLVGYDVAELRKLRKSYPNYMLAEMLAYKVVTVEEVMERVGFKKSQSVWLIARGGNQSTSDRVASIKTLYSEKKDLLQSVKKDWQKELGIETSTEKVTPFSKPETSVSEKTETVPTSRPGIPINDGFIDVVANLVKTITPLLEGVEAGTKEQRALLRKLTGSDGMFRLSKTSSRLCSEKALEVPITSGHKA